MGRAATGATQATIKRAIAAATQAGVRSYRLNIEPNGTVSILVGPDAVKATTNTCDDLLV